jgi:ubiquinol-cytochrome c reductase iron-sulfur subunit
MRHPIAGHMAAPMPIPPQINDLEEQGWNMASHSEAHTRNHSNDHSGHHQGRKDVAHDSHAHDPNRRDMLMVATGAVAAVGGALTVWPLISQMNPDASVKALASVEVDLASLAEGQALTIKWRGNPVFIRHRTKAEIEAAKAVTLTDLKDTNARSALTKDGSPATDENRTVAGKEQYMVMMAVCTHLGCVPVGNEGEFAVVEGSAKTGGWFCPCHGSHYDTAGRIRKGPAPENLAVPLYKFLSDTKIQIG